MSPGQGERPTQGNAQDRDGDQVCRMEGNQVYVSCETSEKRQNRSELSLEGTRGLFQANGDTMNRDTET